MVSIPVVRHNRWFIPSLTTEVIMENEYKDFKHI